MTRKNALARSHLSTIQSTKNKFELEQNQRNTSLTAATVGRGLTMKQSQRSNQAYMAM